MPELRTIHALTDREMVESVLRVWAAMPWREQVCGLCGHGMHAVQCTEPSDDLDTENCGCPMGRRSC